MKKLLTTSQVQTGKNGKSRNDTEGKTFEQIADYIEKNL